MNNNNGRWGVLGGLLGGVIIGWIIGVSMSDGNEEIRKKLKRLKNELIDPDEEIVKGIFGSISEDARNIYMETKNRLIEKLRKINKDLDKISEKDYIKSVQDVIREIQSKLTLPDEQAEKLQNYFEENYELVKKNIKNLS